ncbi:unnamed protein product [marine sediment metagenome]|uniref:Uncharacterized protein n=2 Tax=marine sediment metagenome TaxID=412755 RepID=X1VZA0_9ZZZZ
MDIDKAISELTLFTNGYKTRPDPDLLEAAKMGTKGLVLLAYSKGHRLDDLSLNLLLDAERKEDER